MEASSLPVDLHWALSSPPEPLLSGIVAQAPWIVQGLSDSVPQGAASKRLPVCP